jgi:hypothetical protein
LYTVLKLTQSRRKTAVRARVARCLASDRVSSGCSAPAKRNNLNFKFPL